MSDRPTSGPAPRWGEYGPQPEHPPVPPPAAMEPEPTAPPVPPARAADRTAAPASASRTWDRVLTIALLAFGLFNVLTGIPAMLQLAESLDQAYAAQGFGDYTSVGLASAVGVAANVVNVLLLVMAVAWSVRRLRTGRLAFWIPLVAGAVSVFVMIVLIGAAIFGDPALATYVQDMQEQTAP